MSETNPDETLDELKARLEADAAQARAEAEAAQREAAFMRAGVDIQTPQGQLFAKGYEGEMTNEAIQAGYGAIFGEQGGQTDSPPEASPQQQGQAPPPEASFQTPGGFDPNAVSQAFNLDAVAGAGAEQAVGIGTDSSALLAAIAQEQMFGDPANGMPLPPGTSEVNAQIREAFAKGDARAGQELLASQGLGMTGGISA
ncbi:MAG: hypothetical protein OXG44_21590 [Gammaproteobacteria bacterium]|nr:hypothetical protein [Gammaproteobacteria bacterium]